MGPVKPGQHRSSSRRIRLATSPCRLQVEDTFVQPPANATEATPTIGTLDYTPLSTRCKFNLFLKQTHSPSTFVSAAFQATLDQARGNGPTMAEERKVGGSDLARLWRTQNRGDSSRPLRLSTILHQDPRYFPSRKRTLIARGRGIPITRVAVTRNDRGDNTFNTSEFLGLYSPARYKMPTTHGMTERSGIP